MCWNTVTFFLTFSQIPWPLHFLMFSRTTNSNKLSGKLVTELVSCSIAAHPRPATPAFNWFHDQTRITTFVDCVGGFQTECRWYNYQDDNSVAASRCLWAKCSDLNISEAREVELWTGVVGFNPDLFGVNATNFPAAEQVRQQQTGWLKGIWDRKWPTGHLSGEPRLGGSLTMASLVWTSCEAELATFWMMGAMLVGP